MKQQVFKDMINGKGKHFRNDDFIIVAEPFGFEAKKVQEIIKQTDDALSEYKKYEKDIGIK